MAHIQIAVLNQSKYLNNDEVQHVANILQIQIQEHFVPKWRIDADILFYPDNNPPSTFWQLVILDDTDQAGALGYHDLTEHGLPMGKVFAGTDISAGNSWSVTASHEILELLADPDINLTVFCQANDSFVLYAYEICDPCEGDMHSYEIENVRVSNFVFPSWFQDMPTPYSQFDYCNKITKPFQLLPGGFANIYDMASGKGWQQLGMNNISSIIPVGSRRYRRTMPRGKWLRSFNKKN